MQSRPRQHISPQQRPWYREPWPWIIMSGPAIVVVASFVTLWLAIVSADGIIGPEAGPAVVQGRAAPK